MPLFNRSQMSYGAFHDPFMLEVPGRSRLPVGIPSRTDDEELVLLLFVSVAVNLAELQEVEPTRAYRIEIF